MCLSDVSGMHRVGVHTVTVTTAHDFPLTCFEMKLTSFPCGKKVAPLQEHFVQFSCLSNGYVVNLLSIDVGSI